MASDRARVVKGRGDIFIGRPGIWGNPFRIGLDGDREQVIQRYKEWIVKQPTLIRLLYTLKGKRLGCYCAPLPCHGDILIELMEEL